MYVPPLSAAGRGHGGVLWRHVGRHVEALFIGERGFDLLQRLPLGLGDEEENKDDGGKADTGVEPVGAVAAHHVIHCRKGLEGG